MRSSELHEGLDHIGYYSEDIDGAYARFSSFGFSVMPPSVFETQPFATSAIMLGDTYISLSGVFDWTSAPEWMRQGMGAGIQAFVLRSSDLDAVWWAIGPDGNDELRLDGTVQRITRVLAGDGERVSFRVLRLKRGSLPALARCNYCEHLTPTLMWREPWLTHPNGAHSLRALIAVHDRPAELANFYRRLFDRVEMEPEGDLLVDCRTAALRIITPAALEARYGGLAPPFRPGEPLLAGAEIGVTSIEKTSAVLGANAIDVARRDGRLVIDAAQAYGGVLEFVQADRPARTFPPVEA